MPLGLKDALVFRRSRLYPVVAPSPGRTACVMLVSLVPGLLCSQMQLIHHDSLQIPFTDEVPNGVKVSECITLNLCPSLLLTPLVSCPLPLAVPWGYRSALPSLCLQPNKTILISDTWPTFGLISRE